jgi:hypothetical protein
LRRGWKEEKEKWSNPTIPRNSLIRETAKKKGKGLGGRGKKLLLNEGNNFLSIELKDAFKLLQNDNLLFY